GGACTCPGGGMPNAQNECCLGPRCSACIAAVSSGAEDAVAAAAMQDSSTFVVGVATGSGAEAVLNKMAVNGKTARPGATKYYPVSSSTELVNTINSIAGQIISCNLPLGTPPAHPEFVKISIDG